MTLHAWKQREVRVFCTGSLKTNPLPKDRLHGNKSSNEERQREIRTIITDGLQKKTERNRKDNNRLFMNSLPVLSGSHAILVETQGAFLR
jgi:hypothetical protein